MKNLIGFLAVLVAVNANAQQDTTGTAPSDSLEISNAPKDGDTTIVRLGNHQLKIVERPGKDEVLFEKKIEDEWIPNKDVPKDENSSGSKWHRKNMLTHWSGVTFGINGYIGDNESLELPEGLSQMEVDYSKSFSLALNFPELKFRLIGDYVGIYTGLGVQFNNYRLRQNTHLTFGDEVTMMEDTVRNLTRNTISATYLRVPLMIEFNTSQKPTKTFHVAAGVVGGFRLMSSYVQNYNEQGVDYVNRVESIPNLNLFTAEAMVRVGYGPFVLYASYGLTPMFELKEGPELYPISAGLGFAF